jgi:hypothetical protein
MGADLYINSIFNPNMQKYSPKFEKAVKDRSSYKEGTTLYEQAQKKVERYYDLMYAVGYFRDSYNASSLLNALGLSWWQNVIPMLDKEQCLNLTAIKKFKGMVKKAKLSTIDADWVINNYAGGPVEEWQQYFIEKKGMLLAYLDKALKEKSKIYCSL